MSTATKTRRRGSTAPHTARLLVDGWPLTFAVARDLNIVYPLTACCGVAAAAVDGGGVECGRCLTKIDERYGLAWNIAEAADTLECPTCGDTHHWCPQSPLNGKGSGE